MNKTLLLIICDFLLISILALVEFKPNLPDAEVEDSAVIENSAGEMLELLQLSLEHENQRRESVESELNQKAAALDETARTLDETRSNLQETAQQLDQTAAAKARLEATTAELSSSLEFTRSSLEMTEAEKARIAQALEQTRARTEQLQTELQSEQERAAQRAAELANATENLRELEATQNTLQTELKIRDTEREMLQQNLLAARAEVERARLEAQAAERRVEALSANVSELAASSTAISTEIRQAQPLSLNAIYQRFETNRVMIRFNWEERRLFGSLSRDATIQSLLVEENGSFFALFSTENTPLDTVERPSAAIQISGRTFRITEFTRLRANDRIATIQIPAEVVTESGLQAFSLSDDPLRFTEAVLISDTQAVYGEIPLRIPPGEPGRLQIEPRLLSRLFGEYSPRMGDYVFSKSGALIGVMTAPNRAQILSSLEPDSTHPLR